MGAETPKIDVELVKYLHTHSLEIVTRIFSGPGKFGTEDTKIIVGVRTKPAKEETTEE